jgi:hypothetical protein
MSTQKNVEWLQHHTDQYQSTTNDMCEALKDIDEVEKLGQGFSSTDPLEEMDIGDGITPVNVFCTSKNRVIKIMRSSSEVVL